MKIVQTYTKKKYHASNNYSVHEQSVAKLMSNVRKYPTRQRRRDILEPESVS